MLLKLHSTYLGEHFLSQFLEKKLLIYIFFRTLIKNILVGFVKTSFLRVLKNIFCRGRGFWIKLWLFSFFLEFESWCFFSWRFHWAKIFQLVLSNLQSSGQGNPFGWKCLKKFCYFEIFFRTLIEKAQLLSKVYSACPEEYSEFRKFFISVDVHVEMADEWKKKLEYWVNDFFSNIHYDGK